MVKPKAKMQINSINTNRIFGLQKDSGFSNLQRNFKENQTYEVNFNKVWSAVDSYFDLGDPNKTVWMSLNPAEKEQYWKIVAKLIHKGIFGYRYYEINGKLERHLIEYEIANPRLANAKVKYYNKIQYTKEWVV